MIRRLLCRLFGLRVPRATADYRDWQCYTQRNKRYPFREPLPQTRYSTVEVPAIASQSATTDVADVDTIKVRDQQTEPLRVRVAKLVALELHGEDNA